MTLRTGSSQGNERVDLDRPAPPLVITAYIRMRVAIWSCRIVPARRRPPQIGSDSLNQPRVRARVGNVFVGAAGPCSSGSRSRRVVGHRVRLAFRLVRYRSSNLARQTPARGPRTQRCSGKRANRQRKCVDNDCSQRSAAAGEPPAPGVMGVSQTQTPSPLCLALCLHRSYRSTPLGGCRKSVRRALTESGCLELAEEKRCVRPREHIGLGRVLPSFARESAISRLRIVSDQSDRPGEGGVLGALHRKAVGVVGEGRRGQAIGTSKE